MAWWLISALLLETGSLGIGGAQEKEGIFHYKNVLRASKLPTQLSKNPKLGLSLDDLNPQQREFWVIRQVWHVIPHFEALKNVL